VNLSEGYFVYMMAPKRKPLKTY